MKTIRILLVVIGTLLGLLAFAWLLQGIGVFNAGRPHLAVNGAAGLIAGIIIILAAKFTGSKSKSDLPVIRSVLAAIGTVFSLAGLIWILQGTGILPGSIMSGKIKWAINGSVGFVIGVIIILGAKFAAIKKEGLVVPVISIIIITIGTIFTVQGLHWLLQGLKVMPGRMMSGKLQWVINGGIVFIIGIALITGTWFAKRDKMK